MKQTLTIVGTIRNVSRVLENEVDRVVGLLSNRYTLYIFLVESDSEDSTSEALKRLSDKYEFFSYISMGNLRFEIPDRIERLIQCRNRYIQEIRDKLHLRNSEFTLMIDLDNRNTKLSIENFETSINQKTEWAALFCNQSGRYYDILALRHKVWCPNSVSEEVAWYSKMMNKGDAKDIAIFPRMVKIPKSNKLIPVDSAYGGLAIYKTKFLLEADFSRTEEDSTWDIDFVILNKKIARLGGKLYIDPQLVNLSWVQHSLEYYLSYRIFVLVNLKALSISKKTRTFFSNLLQGIIRKF